MLIMDVCGNDELIQVLAFSAASLNDRNSRELSFDYLHYLQIILFRSQTTLTSHNENS